MSAAEWLLLLADALANLECVLQNEFVTGDHAIFVGRVVVAHVNEDQGVTRLYSLGNGKLGGLDRSAYGW